MKIKFTETIQITFTTKKFTTWISVIMTATLLDITVRRDVLPNSNSVLCPGFLCAAWTVRCGLSLFDMACADRDTNADRYVSTRGTLARRLFRHLSEDEQAAADGRQTAAVVLTSDNLVAIRNCLPGCLLYTHRQLRWFQVTSSRQLH